MSTSTAEITIRFARNHCLSFRDRFDDQPCFAAEIINRRLARESRLPSITTAVSTKLAAEIRRAPRAQWPWRNSWHPARLEGLQ
jgi:hypothetical protein